MHKNPAKMLVNFQLRVFIDKPVEIWQPFLDAIAVLYHYNFFIFMLIKLCPFKHSNYFDQFWLDIK